MVFQREDCRWAWRLKADNGRIIAVDGSQGYENESDARAIVDRILRGDFSDAKKKRSPRDDCP